MSSTRFGGAADKKSHKALKVVSRISWNRALTSRRSIKTFTTLAVIYVLENIYRGARYKISTKFKELFSQYLSKVSVIAAFLYYRAFTRLL